MNEVLEKILNEIQGLKIEMNERFELIDKKFEKIEERFKLIDKKLEKIEERFELIDKKLEKMEERFELIDKKLEEMEEKFKLIDKRFEEIEKRFEEIDKKFEEIDKMFEIQMKELAQELRTMADFIYKRDKKLIERLEEKINKETKYNKTIQKAHEAKISRIELYQEALESKFYDLVTIKKDA